MVSHRYASKPMKMKNLAMILTILIPLTFAFTSPESIQTIGPEISLDNNCPPPTNIHAVDQTSNSVTYDWDDCTCANPRYRMYYVKNGVTSSLYMTAQSNYTFTNLSPGLYQFYFYRVCGGGRNSIIIEDTILI